MDTCTDKKSVNETKEDLSGESLQLEQTLAPELDEDENLDEGDNMELFKSKLAPEKQMEEASVPQIIDSSNDENSLNETMEDIVPDRIELLLTLKLLEERGALKRRERFEDISIERTGEFESMGTMGTSTYRNSVYKTKKNALTEFGRMFMDTLDDQNFTVNETEEDSIEIELNMTPKERFLKICDELIGKKGPKIWTTAERRSKRSDPSRSNR